MLDDDVEAPGDRHPEVPSNSAATGATSLSSRAIKEECPRFPSPGMAAHPLHPGEIGQQLVGPPARGSVSEGRCRQLYGLVTTLPYSAAHAGASTYRKGLCPSSPTRRGPGSETPSTSDAVSAGAARSLGDRSSSRGARRRTVHSGGRRRLLGAIAPRRSQGSG